MKTRKLIFVPVLLLLAFRLFADDAQASMMAEKKIVSKSEAWKGKKSAQIELLLSVGTDDFDKENYIFGSINDIEVDASGNIYALDARNNRVQKYSAEGKYLSSFGGTEGVGPGDLLDPRRITLDTQNNLYITNLTPRTISIFDPGGNFVKLIKLPAAMPLSAMPGDITVGGNGKLYVAEVRGFSAHFVNIFNTSSGELAGSICEKFDQDILLTRRGTWTGCLCTDTEGNICFSYFYPYEIRKYSIDGKLLLKFSRHAPFYKPPYLDKRKVLRSVAGTWHLISLPDGKLINLIHHRILKKRKTYVYLDVFDKNGDWLISIPSDKIDPEWKGMVIASDNQGNIYLPFTAPYPHIRKYSLKFVAN